MTREEFITQVQMPSNANTFKFKNGFGIVIRLNDKHYGIHIDENNHGEYETVEELLDNFKINGVSFADFYLPKIDKLTIVVT